MSLDPQSNSDEVQMMYFQQVFRKYETWGKQGKGHMVFLKWKHNCSSSPGYPESGTL